MAADCQMIVVSSQPTRQPADGEVLHECHLSLIGVACIAGIARTCDTVVHLVRGGRRYAMGIGRERRSRAVVTPPASDIAIYLCEHPVDFRLGINGLSEVLYWQMSEFWLRQRWLEEERFCLPSLRQGHCSGQIR